jgi:hypothetical protein
MSKQYQSKRIEELTSAEIYEAIRYLEPNATSDQGQFDLAALLFWIGSFVVMSGAIWLLWFYRFF